MESSKRALALLDRDPEMSRRVRRWIDSEALPVHAERVREWVESNEGAFPDFEDARGIVADELAVLCEALGYLARIDPGEYQRALNCVNPGRPSRDTDPDWYS